MNISSIDITLDRMEGEPQRCYVCKKTYGKAYEIIRAFDREDNKKRIYKMVELCTKACFQRYANLNNECEKQEGKNDFTSEK